MDYRFRVESYPDREGRLVLAVWRGDTRIMEFDADTSQMAILQGVRDFLNRDKREIALAEDEIYRLRGVLAEARSLLMILLGRLKWCSAEIEDGEKRKEVLSWVTLAEKKWRSLSLRS